MRTKRGYEKVIWPVLSVYAGNWRSPPGLPLRKSSRASMTTDNGLYRTTDLAEAVRHPDPYQTSRMVFPVALQITLQIYRDVRA